ncbi:tyrosine-type recombinase/integrase [Isoptericola dokdonensis]|uniref:Site-specific tyrosine recombinase XerC n=1 Tax=Isoptericola dokdonensis DS-3 TaxID=1300344 RepID=A0A161HQK3_9MICO|nr:site-specific integrase [Isoptericola dokdonensis]ANC31472.1 site-specific tyrosine recombinase XerC [Isoptericola dokdonensis DS-3]
MSRGRPPLPIGTWGEISTRRLPSGAWQAKARYRDYDGRTRAVTRSGQTEAAAKRALRTDLAQRTPPVLDEISDRSRLSAVAEVWLAEVWAAVDAGDRSPTTASRYRQVWRVHVDPGLGERLMREMSVPAVDRFLKAVTAAHGAATAKLCRSVLAGVCGLAVRHGALTTNPTKDAGTIRVASKEPRALTPVEIARFRASARNYQAGGPQPDGRPRQGPPTTVGIADILDVLLATGARIGEVLALRWSDVDLGKEPTVRICGTLVHVDGQGWIRKPKTKTGEDRVLELPPFAVESLMRRRVEIVLPNVHDAVFPSTAGTWHDPNNIRTPWRKARDEAGLESWITPHSMRRTVATYLDGAADTRIAAQQLGDTEHTTRRHYIERDARGPAVRDLLQVLAVPPQAG